MDNKKTYTPEEVAEAVLKKTHELWKASKLAKAANTSHEVELGEEPNNDDAEAPEYLADADIEDDYKEDEKRKSGKKKSGEAEEDSAEGEDKHAEEPEHEKDMAPEAEKEHDAAENEADEKDEDKVEADEEAEAGVSDEDEADLKDTDDVIKEAADDSDAKDEKKKKPGMEKSEITGGKLKKFMARRAIKKMEKVGTDCLPEDKAKKAKKIAKNKAVEKMLGMKGCK